MRLVQPQERHKREASQRFLAKQHAYETELVNWCGELYFDPYAWVMGAFPWGEPNTLLENETGPDVWQTAMLCEIRDELYLKNFDGNAPVDPLQYARASGHGIGKSAFVSWINLFLMSTRPYCSGVVTASTAPQLRTKTWAELAKWRALCITGHWFTITAGQHLSMYHNEHKATWKVVGQTCKEENSEAFAGNHAANSTPYFIFDEASGIPDKIFEVAQGGLTDGEPWFLCFGNATKNSGFFHKITFGIWKRYWNAKSIDSRTCKKTNKGLLDRWKEIYGEASDWYKVRVRGLPPDSGTVQFISRELVQGSRTRPMVSPEEFQPYIIGVDVARFGDDKTVIKTRRGRDARSVNKIEMRGASTTEVAARVALHVDKLGVRNCAAPFVDGGGIGGGVIDAYRALGRSCIEINFGGKPTDKRYRYKGDEMWGLMKEWLAIGCIPPNDEDLEAQLVIREFGYTVNENKINLESKDELKSRGEVSPDDADALALTFAEPVGPLEHKHPLPPTAQRTAKKKDYDPFSRIGR